MEKKKALSNTYTMQPPYDLMTLLFRIKQHIHDTAPYDLMTLLFNIELCIHVTAAV